MEPEVITATSTPVTRSALVDDLRALGVRDGAVLMVHSSLSKLGWVAGGAHAVALALLESVGADGTLVMPAHTGLSEPRYWEHPPVPESWWPVIRDHTPAYDPAVTPTRGMGAVVEVFRTMPGVVRSAHPLLSVAAAGPRAHEITAAHALDDALGERSPLARLYDLDASILLLGIDHAHNTTLHLAEHRAHCDKRVIEHGAPVMVDGERRWVTWSDLDGNSDDFAALGDDFARDTGLERRGRAGAGEARLVSTRPIVDYAVHWLERHRA